MKHHASLPVGPSLGHVARGPRSRARRLGAALAITSLLRVLAVPAEVPAAVPVPAASLRADGADLAAVARVLRRRAPDDDRSEREVARELAALGPGAVPELYGLVNGRALRYLARGEALDATRWVCRPDRFEAVARTALARMPEAAVRTHLAAAGLENGADLAALHVLGELGSAQALGLVLEIGEGFEPLALRSRPMRRAFEDALAATLREDPEAWSRLQGPLERLRPDLRAIAVEVVVEADRPEAAPVLASLIGSGSPPDAELIDAIAELVRRHAWHGLPAADEVRAHLQDNRPEVRAASAHGVARMRDAGAPAGRSATGSLHRLIELCDDPAPAVRAAATDALRELGATRVPADREAWEAWLAGEEAWWAQERERLAAGVSDAEPAEVLATVRELAAHPALRRETGPLIAHVLGSDEPACVEAACAALARIGFAQAVPALGLLLFESDDDVRAAAGAALGALTGDDLPLDGMAWDERIRG